MAATGWFFKARTIIFEDNVEGFPMPETLGRYDAAVSDKNNSSERIRRGVEKWHLERLITLRLWVRIPPPQPRKHCYLHEQDAQCLPTATWLGSSIGRAWDS